MDEDDEKTAAGYLIVKTSERMVRERLGMLGLPWIKTPDQVTEVKRFAELSRRYRGIDRDPIQPWIEALRGNAAEPMEQELAASLFMNDLQNAGKALWDFVFSLRDAEQLIQMIVPPVEREIIWVRRMNASDPPPPGTRVLGYEPSWFFAPEHGSAILQDWEECLFFLKGYADTAESKTHCEKLNEWLLFDTPADAEQYSRSFSHAYEQAYRAVPALFVTEVRVLL